MFLATITCNRDFNQMLLQAESIQKFLEPCKHVIILNEDNPDFDFWYRWLKPYYTKHSLEILPRINYDYPVAALGYTRLGNFDHVAHGWRMQQLQKLLLAYQYNEDYLLLDSKNFFIRNASLENYSNLIGPGNYSEAITTKPFNETVENYTRLFGYSPKYYFKPQTPFKIESRYLTEKCELSKLGYMLFYPHFYHSPASEFIFYSYLVDEHAWEKATETLDCTLWLNYKEDLEHYLKKVLHTPVFLTSGVHRLFLSKIDEKELNMINAWIKVRLGLKNKIHPLPRDSNM